MKKLVYSYAKHRTKISLLVVAWVFVLSGGLMTMNFWLFLNGLIGFYLVSFFFLSVRYAVRDYNEKTFFSNNILTILLADEMFLMSMLFLIILPLWSILHIKHFSFGIPMLLGFVTVKGCTLISKHFKKKIVHIETDKKVVK